MVGGEGRIIGLLDAMNGVSTMRGKSRDFSGDGRSFACERLVWISFFFSCTK